MNWACFITIHRKQLRKLRARNVCGGLDCKTADKLSRDLECLKAINVYCTNNACKRRLKTRIWKRVCQRFVVLSGVGSRNREIMLRNGTLPRNHRPCNSCAHAQGTDFEGLYIRCTLHIGRENLGGQRRVGAQI
jgi:hypothetical protein